MFAYQDICTTSNLDSGNHVQIIPKPRVLDSSLNSLIFENQRNFSLRRKYLLRDEFFERILGEFAIVPIRTNTSVETEWQTAEEFGKEGYFAFGVSVEVPGFVCGYFFVDFEGGEEW
jgi:hypothetical protein